MLVNLKMFLYIKAVVLADIHIQLYRRSLKQGEKAVEETSGINVTDVKISVENVYTGYKSRVE